MRLRPQPSPSRYNDALLTDEEKHQQQQDLKEESGWKLVYGDVFRPPPFAGVLAVYTGRSTTRVGFFFFFLALYTQSSPRECHVFEVFFSSVHW